MSNQTFFISDIKDMSQLVVLRDWLESVLAYAPDDAPILTMRFMEEQLAYVKQQMFELERPNYYAEYQTMIHLPCDGKRWAPQVLRKYYVDDETFLSINDIEKILGGYTIDFQYIITLSELIGVPVLGRKDHRLVHTCLLERLFQHITEQIGESEKVDTLKRALVDDYEKLKWRKVK
jgi:hypothetical protein